MVQRTYNMQESLPKKCSKCGNDFPIKFGVPFYQQEMLSGRPICNGCKDKELGW